MKILATFFNCLAGTKFLIGLCLVLSFLSLMGVMLNLQEIGSLLTFLVNKNILSYDAIQTIQNFALQDNQRKHWFIFCVMLGLILSGIGFIRSVRHHEKTGKGTGGRKLVYLGLLLIFASGSIDSIFGFKGTTVLQKQSVMSAITLQDGTVKPILFSLKLDDFIIKNKEDADDEVKLSVIEGEEKHSVFLEPWMPLHQGLYTMYYYGMQDAQPLITFYAKSLVDLTKSPVMIGLQVGSKIENKQDEVSFQLTNINKPNAPLIPIGKIVQGFKNEGRSIDYIMEHKGEAKWLRTFEHYPHTIAVSDDKGSFIQIPFGLSISSPSGWDVLEEYRDYLSKNKVADKKEAFKNLKSLEKYSKVLHPVIQNQVFKASSVINMFKLPYVLQMDRVYPLNQITLNVLYEPGIYLAYLGVFFLMAGLFVSVTFSRRRKK